jgi:glycosyltransferase involved in cell wall biosynthesis
VPAPIRVLAVDHTAGVLPFRKKFDAIAAHPDVRLTVLAPERWIENGREVLATAGGGAGYSFRVGPVGWPGYENRAFFRGGIGPALRASAPEVLHLWEEPFSAIALQTLLLARLHAPRAKALFFSSDNLSGDFRYPYRPSAAYATVERLVHRWCAMGTAVSREVEETLRRKGFAKPIVVVPHGIDPADYGLAGGSGRGAPPRRAGPAEVAARLGLAPPVVAFAGRLRRQKGVDLLLRAGARLAEEGPGPAPSLALIGSGEEEGPLRSLAYDLGLGDRVRFLPGVPHREVPSLLACVEILVLPSRTTPGSREQFGRVLIEGMAAGCCVVGARSGGIPEVVGDAGLLFPEEGVAELSDALRRVLADDGLRAALRAAGLARVRAEYTWEAVARKVVGIYRDLAGRGAEEISPGRGRRP